MNFRSDQQIILAALRDDIQMRHCIEYKGTVHITYCRCRDCFIDNIPRATGAHSLESEVDLKLFVAMTFGSGGDVEQNVRGAVDGDLVAGTRIHVEEFNGDLCVTCDYSGLSLGLRWTH